MPRCQWCRQDSQDPNICDWCKRPLAAGWTPAATAAAIPADRMSFAAQADEPTNDRLLMFSVLGIVALVAMAFLYSMLTRHQSLPSVQPATPDVVEQSQPVQRTPSTVDTGQAVETDPQPSPAPVVQQPTYDDTPAYEAPPPPPVYPHRTGTNRKMAGITEAAGVIN